MNFGGWDLNSLGENLSKAGESLTRDLGAGFEQLKKGVEETLKQEDDDEGSLDADPAEEWFGAMGIDSLVKTLVGEQTHIETHGADQGGERGQEEDGDEGDEGEEGTVLDDRGTAEPEVEVTPLVERVEEPMAAARPDEVRDGAGKGDAGVEVENARASSATGMPRRKKSTAEETGLGPGPLLTIETSEHVVEMPPKSEECTSPPPSPPKIAPGASPPPPRPPPPVEENRNDTSVYEAQIRTLEERVAKQAKELAVAKKRAIKEREEKQEVETRLRAKDKEIQDVMAEGEALSKKQLVLETSVKQLKTQLAKSQRDLAAREAALQAEKQRNEDVTSSQADHESELSRMKVEHEETVKMLRAELVANERKLSDLSKDGSSDARKLQDAQNRASALQDSLDEVREEMRRQRLGADEREEMLQSEIAVLQRRCSEAEARHKDSESRLPEATAPLLAQVETLRKKLEDQDEVSMAAQKRLIDKIDSLEKTVEGLQREKRAFADETEEATSRFDILSAQLVGAQQKASDAERTAAEERIAKQKAEATLASAQAELKGRIDALTTTEGTLKKTIRELEEELIRERTAREEAERKRELPADIEKSSNGGGDRGSPLPREERHDPRLNHRMSPERVFATDGSENTLRRKIRELEETREKLSAALVEAEQRAAAGDSAKRDLDDVRKKLVAASEVIGEKEETIDELRADLADIKEILASQQDILATAVSRSLSVSNDP